MGNNNLVIMLHFELRTTCGTLIIYIKGGCVTHTLDPINPRTSHSRNKYTCGSCILKDDKTTQVYSVHPGILNIVYKI